MNRHTPEVRATLKNIPRIAIERHATSSSASDPAPAPSSINFDAMLIARIGAKDFPKDGEADRFLDYWFGQFEQNPESLYTSDGHPDTITIPGGYAGMLDEEKVAAQGKQVIEY